NSKIGFGDLILLLRYFFKLKVSTHPIHCGAKMKTVLKKGRAELKNFRLFICDFDRDKSSKKSHFHEEWENNRKILNSSCLKTR
ncbi:hypothetical protein ABTF34_04650, partial [Acinetobacter baumannii]